MLTKRFVFILILVLSTSTFSVFAQLKLDSQGKTIIGNFTSSLRLECRGPVAFTRWGESLKKQMPINTKGNGSTTIRASELSAGMCLYSLIVDGKEIGSMRMILTE